MRTPSAGRSSTWPGVDDDQVADAFGSEQVWTAQGWYERFGLPFDRSETASGQSTAEVGQVAVTAACCSDTWTRSTTPPVATSAASPTPTSTGSSTPPGTPR